MSSLLLLLLLMVVSSLVDCRPEGRSREEGPGTTPTQVRPGNTHLKEVSPSNLPFEDDSTGESTVHPSESPLVDDDSERTVLDPSANEAIGASTISDSSKDSPIPSPSMEDSMPPNPHQPNGGRRLPSEPSPDDDSKSIEGASTISDDSDKRTDSPTGTPETPQNGGPPKKSVREALIEELKSKILRKLHLPSAPSNVSPFHLPPDVVRLMHKDDDQPREKENLIVHPSNSSFNCSSTGRLNGCCSRLQFNISAAASSVLSAQAWVRHRKGSPSLVLSVLSAEEEGEVVATIREDPLHHPDWVMFQLPTSALEERGGGTLRCTLQTTGGEIHTSGEDSPFLVVNKYVDDEPAPQRSRRNSDGGNCSCCTENHYITVKDLGWQNWVISPPGFNVKTCAGTCDENRASFNINYQRIVSTLYKINRDIPRPACSFWAPSCKPDSYLPQRMMYLFDNGTVHDHLLPDMLIGSCRCL